MEVIFHDPLRRVVRARICTVFVPAIVPDFPETFGFSQGGWGSQQIEESTPPAEGKFEIPWGVCTEGGGPFSVEPPFMGWGSLANPRMLQLEPLRVDLPAGGD